MKIAFNSLCHTPEAELTRNREHAKSLGFPYMGEAGGPLAVVGGGPSVLEHIDTLQNWEGDVWAVNGAWKWCRDNGIPATFFTAEARPIPRETIDGVKKAFISTSSSVNLFNDLISQGAHIEAVDPGEHAPGPTTATAFLIHMTERGHRDIVFFGCESSFNGKTHVYDDKAGSELDVMCGGEKFQTRPYMMMQAEILSAVIRAAPHIYSERSGGLLRAMISDPEVDAVAATKDIHDALGL